ncbi:MAG: hypothetical protein ACTSRI_18095 [Promethearchaeota archaeon]
MIVKDLIKNSKKLVLDTGIYIEYFKTKEDKIKEYLRKTLFTDESEVKIYANYILKSEIYYVLCRALGKEKTYMNWPGKLNVNIPFPLLIAIRSRLELFRTVVTSLKKLS